MAKGPSGAPVCEGPSTGPTSRGSPRSPEFAQHPESVDAHPPGRPPEVPHQWSCLQERTRRKGEEGSRMSSLLRFFQTRSLSWNGCGERSSGCWRHACLWETLGMKQIGWGSPPRGIRARVSNFSLVRSRRPALPRSSRIAPWQPTGHQSFLLGIRNPEFHLSLDTECGGPPPTPSGHGAGLIRTGAMGGGSPCRLKSRCLRFRASRFFLFLFL